MSERYPISVVIPVHNAVQTVQRAIDSAFKNKAAEVVVVDDGSTDGTTILLDALKDTYPENTYKVLHTDAQFPAGVCHARNLGITHARFDAIVPLDADDYFVFDGLEALYVNWGSVNQVVYGNRFEEEQYGGGRLIPITAPLPMRLGQKNLTGATFLFSREMWQHVGGYHPDFNLGCEDWAFMAALVTSGAKMVLVNLPIYIYTSGGSRAKRCIQYADALHQLLREHYPAVFKTGFDNAQQGH